MGGERNLVIVNGYWLPESGVELIDNNVYVEIGLLAASLGINYQKEEKGYILSRIEPALFGRIIAIDPAHGGADYGVVGPNGVLEKDVNLDVALRLSIMLELAGGTVVLTRKTDSAVTPEARQSTLLEAGVECLIIIHQSDAPGIRGYHRGDLESHRFASAMHQELVSDLQLRDLGLHVATMDLLHLIPVPGAIVETMSLADASTEKMTTCIRKRQQAAAALYRGIRAFFEGI
ncbi:MAG TPA: N-acetylmuramoyl-L-alanine amidase [Firmicutes bacterium]|jgi:N-acetylmuramoyl-L-alanine amidase|nr:N-acetylmuramoyl-L-alanine amidase [Bacillota bacterium]